MRRQALIAGGLAGASLLGWIASAFAQMPPAAGAPTGAAGGMPNLGAVNGRPLPDSGMAAGTVSVRVVRKMPSNPAAGVEVTALIKNAGGDMRKRTARTDEGGRAVFEGMSGGDEFRAEVTVDGEKIATQAFAIPSQGGLRTMLIAGLDKSARAGGEGGDGEPFTLGVTAGEVVPDESLPGQTFDLRLFDEQGKPIANQPILLGMVGKEGKVEVRRGRSDAAGTARFDGLPVGPEMAYAAIIEHHGLRLGTTPFSMPESGGARGEIRALARTSDPSVITLGPGGRIVVQLREDTLQFLEMLPLENRSEKLFDPGPGAIEIPLPQGFVGAQGSQESERKVEVRQNHGIAAHGPIVPKRALVGGGETGRDARRTGQEVAFGFVLPYSGSEKEFEQPMPNGIGPFTLITEQIPGLTVSGPGVGSREPRELGGRKYWVMPVEGVPPGGTLRFTLHGLPAIDSTGQTVAGALAIGLVLAAIVFARPSRAERGGKKPSGGRPREGERDRLVKARETLFGELVALETAARARGGPRQSEQRKQLVAKLEQVYRELASMDDQRAA